MSLAKALWAANTHLARAALEHPFVRGLADGTAVLAGYLIRSLQRRHDHPTEAARSQRTESLCLGVVSMAPSAAFERG